MFLNEFKLRVAEFWGEGLATAHPNSQGEGWGRVSKNPETPHVFKFVDAPSQHSLERLT